MDAPKWLLQLRTTMFLPTFIWYSEDNRKKHIDLLPGAKVRPLLDLSAPMPLAADLQPKEYDKWQIVSKNMSVAFQPNRIDIVCNQLTKNMAFQKDFITDSKMICENIMATLPNMPVLRI